MPVDYQNGKIYTLRSYERPDMVYVGSTTQTLARRLAKHKSSYKCHKKGIKGSHTSSVEMFDVCNDIYIELYEMYPCNNKEELLKREREIVRSLDCINKVIPGRTRRDHYIENKDKILEYHRQYYINNQDKIKEYYINNQEKIKEKKRRYRIDNQEKLKGVHRQYYIKNIDKKKIYDRQYRIENKDKIKEYKHKKIMCDCGQILSRNSLSEHKQTNKHHTQYQKNIYDFIYS